LPALRAAVDPTAQGAQYYGPHGLGGSRGYPVVQRYIKAAYDEEMGRRLWDVSVRLTGVDYPQLVG
jgi:hypothetical protein